MNDNDITSLPGTPTPSAKPEGHKKTYILWTLLLLVLLLAAAVWFCPYFAKRQNAASVQDIAEMRQRLTGLENSVRSLDERMNALGTMGAMSAGSAPAAATEAPSKAADMHTATDVARLQSDLVAVSAALSALQNEVKETSAHAQHSQQATQSVLASAMAYIQLRATATTDQPFAAELSVMRDASPNDNDFQQALGKLQTIAATGAPTVPELRDEFMTLEPAASQAIDKNNAQNGWKKFIVEFKGLVSIRKIHGGGVDAFGGIENDLTKNDVSAALDHMKNLPPEAQKVLADWRGKAEARQNISDALRNLSDHFNNLAKAPAAQGEP